MKICILPRRQRSAHHQADGELVLMVECLDEDLHTITEIQS